MHRLWVFALVVLVAACGQRPGLVLNPSAAGVGQSVPVLFSTTRKQDPEGNFTGRRNLPPLYGLARISVPPEHQTGKVEMRANNVDPQRDFVATELSSFETPAAFRGYVSKQLQALRPQDREVILFVHGFNNNFGDGLYRMAQLASDFEFPGLAVHYSWPSAAHILGYTHDRDSVMFSRDGLEELLIELKRSGVTRVQLVAHSMGAELVVETLRQISIRSNAEMQGLVDGVVFISPDVDVDLFHQQAKRIGKLPDPFIVFTSKRDRALAVSSRLNGASNRLGNLRDVSRLADLDITFLNITDFGKGLGHFTAGSSPALISLLRGIEDLDQAFQQDTSLRSDVLTGTVLTVRNATEIVLAPNL